MRIGLIALLLLSPLALPSLADARPPAREAARASTGLVFVANTGLEDIGTLSSSLRHAVGAKKSGHLDDVVWVVYGRAIVALDPTVEAVPASVRAAIDEAREAGVRLVACNQALSKFDIAPDAVPEGVQIVPNAMTEIARLVADGYAVIRY